MRYCVIIPARNAEDFISEAIESVATQSLPPAEILVVDDGSTDGTAAAASAAGARVLSLPSSVGPSAARNRGVAATTAPLVGFLDADDVWLSVHAERVVAGFGSTDVVFSASCVERIGTGAGLIGNSLNPGEPLDLRAELVADNPIIQSAAFVRRDAFEAAGGYDASMRLAEDYDLWVRLAELGKFVYVAEPTVRRRLHDDQVSVVSRANLVRAGWTVRRKALAKRLQHADASERERVLGVIERAGEADMRWSIWTGEIAMLSLIRSELATTDAAFGLGRRLAVIGGSGAVRRRLAQDAECVARAIVRRVRERV